MHVVKTTHAKKGGKSHKRLKRNEYDATKQKAVAMVMNNITEEAKKIEQSAVQQILEKHIGRPLIQSDVDKVERIATDNGYVLKYDMVMLGEVTRHNHVDHHEDMNYRIVFTPFE